MSPFARSFLQSFLALYIWVVTISRTGLCSASELEKLSLLQSTQHENEAQELIVGQVSARGKMQGIEFEVQPRSDHSVHTRVSSQTGLNATPSGDSYERLRKRQVHLTKRITLIFHYSCSRSQRTRTSFSITIEYAQGTNLVTFLRTGHTQYVIHAWQQGMNPISFGGQLAWNKCIRYHALRMSCLYHYTGYMEGEVYPFDQAMFFDFIQNTGVPRLEPKVTERCFTVGPNGEQNFSGPAQECTVVVEGFVDEPPFFSHATPKMQAVKR